MNQMLLIVVWHTTVHFIMLKKYIAIVGEKGKDFDEQCGYW